MSIRLRILAVMNDPSLFEKANSYLTRHGHQLYICTNLQKIATSLVSIQPDVVLLSWNLRNTNVKKAYELFAHNLGLACMVFPESSSHITSMGLMNSKIRDMILPPLSGPNVERRLLSLFRDKMSEKTPVKYVAEGAKNVGAVQILADEVDPRAEWRKAGQVGFVEEGDSAWYGIVNFGDGRQEVYYCKGKEKPVYDPESKRWLNLDNHNLVLMQENSAASAAASENGESIRSKAFHIIKGAPPEKAMSTFISGLTPERLAKRFDNLLQNEGGEPGTAIVAEEQVKGPGSNEVFDSLLYKCVQETMSQLEIRSTAEPEAFQTVKQICGVPVSTPRFRGFIVIAQAVQDISPDFAMQFQEILYQKLADNGETLYAVEKAFPVLLADFDFRRWSRESAQFAIFGTAGRLGDLVGAAFFNLASFPSLQSTSGSSFMSLDYKGWLQANKKILFDLYIHLPKNDKFLLYKRKGALVDAEALDKFMKFNVASVFIPSEEKNLFWAYCLAARLGASY